jgi:hypothetical protein
MSAPKKSVTVFRGYEPVPEDCSQALAMLLKATVRQEPAGRAKASDEATRSENDTNPRDR